MCIYIYMYGWIDVNASVCLFVFCVCVCLFFVPNYMCTYLCICVYVCLCIFTWQKHIQTKVLYNGTKFITMCHTMGNH